MLKSVVCWPMQDFTNINSRLLKTDVFSALFHNIFTDDPFFSMPYLDLIASVNWKLYQNDSVL